MFYAYSSSVTRNTVKTFLSFGFVLALNGILSADLLVYTYTGVLPIGSSFHSQVSDGESWTVTFVVDDSAMDVDDSPHIGFYPGNVLSGKIEFSGGFYQILGPIRDFATVVFDDYSNYGIIYDSIVVINAEGSSDLLVETFSDDLNTISADSLPGGGFGFSSEGFDGTDYFPQLVWIDVNNQLEGVIYGSGSASEQRVCRLKTRRRQQRRQCQPAGCSAVCRTPDVW